MRLAPHNSEEPEMTKTLEKDGFSYRVDFAAAVISGGRDTTRNFDNCFEMWDGDAVAVALYRRSRRNERLKKNIWRYIGRDCVVTLAYRERRRSNLKAWAAQLRATRQAPPKPRGRPAAPKLTKKD